LFSADPSTNGALRARKHDCKRTIHAHVGIVKVFKFGTDIIDDFDADPSLRVTGCAD